jgi:hypothetical protein
MSKKQSPKSEPARKIRTAQKSDFKKLSPKELVALGYSKTAERYYDIKNHSTKGDKNNTVSKREQAKIVFNITNEQKAAAIKKGTRPILDNAPKKARLAKIESSAEKREKSNKKIKKFDPVGIKKIKNGMLYYSYHIQTYLVMAAFDGNEDALDYLASDIRTILLKHRKDALYRFIFTNGEQTISSHLYLAQQLESSVENLLEEIGKGSVSGVTIDTNNIKIILQVIQK